MSIIRTENFSSFFGREKIIKDLNMEINQNEIFGIIGPANSGKTTFLRSLNRLNDLTPGFSIRGRIFINNEDIYEKNIEVNNLRKNVGMVFARPVVLPLSIIENVVYGPKRQGIKNREELSRIAEKSLSSASLWEEVKDRLNEPAMNLSGGQKQRLCIARALAVKPEIILFDEPCSGLDPISTGKIEESMRELKKNYTIILVTNNTKQAARVSDRTAFFLLGELVEIDLTDRLFTNPKDKRTDDYISGRFG